MPSHPTANTWDDKESVSRTMLYKKITKPLLERQRRARINRCLDELKELMSAALAAEGENLTKLEKADVLELTVRHLHQLHREGELSLNSGAGASAIFQNRPPSSASSVAAAPADRRRYQGGFLACAQQVASYVMKTPGLEPGLGQRLLAHLARCSQQLSPDSPALLGLAGLPPLQPEAGTNNNFAAFPSLTLPVDYHASAAREYSITAQFQVYRPPVAPQPTTLRIIPDDLPLAGHPAETGSSDESVSPGSKRRASPDSFPHIPKKRYAHFNFDGSPPDGRIRTESESEQPVASTSSSSSSSECYVVESPIVQLSPSMDRPPSSSDGKDADSMWRPW